nr:MAG TPA: hypothetical protein [Bacteriophage sp.]
MADRTSNFFLSISEQPFIGSSFLYYIHGSENLQVVFML